MSCCWLPWPLPNPSSSATPPAASVRLSHPTMRFSCHLRLGPIACAGQAGPLAHPGPQRPSWRRLATVCLCVCVCVCVPLAGGSPAKDHPGPVQDWHAHFSLLKHPDTQSGPRSTHLPGPPGVALHPHALAALASTLRQLQDAAHWPWPALGEVKPADSRHCFPQELYPATFQPPKHYIRAQCGCLLPGAQRSTGPLPRS